MYKKIISTLLTLCMALTLLPLNALAAEVDQGNTRLPGTAFAANGTYVLDSGLSIPYTGFNGQEALIGMIDTNSIAHIVFPDSIDGYNITDFHASSFCLCSELKSVTLPIYTSSLQWNFAPHGVAGLGACSKLESIFVSTGNTNFQSIDGVLYSKDGSTVVCYPAGKISTSYSIKQGATTIDYMSFVNCSNITQISIPKSVKTIRDSAFYGCTKLTDVYFDGTEAEWSVISISNNNNSSLTSATIHYNSTGEEVEIISSGECGATENDHVTWTLDKNGLLTISGTGKMKDYDVNSSVSDNPWWDYEIKSVVIKDNITNIGDYAFFACSLTSVIIPNSATSIGEGAFSSCGSLTSIDIPDSIISIEDGAFASCNSLTSVDIPDSVINMGRGVFQDCRGLTKAIILKGYSGGGYTFSGCSSLTSVIIPDGVNRIREGTYQHCSGLTSVTIPNSVTSIKEYAFDDCSNLTDVYYGGTEAQWKTISIEHDNEYLSKATIHYNSTGPEDGGDSPTGTKISLGEIPDDIYVGDSNRIANSFSINWTANDAGKTIHFQNSNPEVFQLTGQTDVTYQGGLASWTIFGNALSVGTSTITITTSDGATANCKITVKPKVVEHEFDPEIYRANRLLNISNTETASMANILSIKTPCNIYVPLLQENGFEASALAWTVLTTTFDALDSPSSLYDFSVKAKDIYSAIILQLLEVSKDYGVVDACNAIISDSKKFVSEINTLLKTEYDIDVSNSYNWSALSEQDQELIKKVSEQFYKENYQADIASVNKVFSNFGKALDIADCLETYLERISSAYALVEMSDSLKTVVRTMYQRCPSADHEYLKLALADCVEIIDSSEEQLMAKLFTDGVSVVGVKVGKYLVDELWKDVKSVANSAFPCLDVILAGYKTGKFISNTLFSTDSTIEQYCAMLATIDVEQLTADVLRFLARTYETSPAKPASSAYLSAIDVLFASREQDCSAAYKFVDILDDAVANQIGALFDQTGANERESIKNSINSIQGTYKSSHSSALTSWIYYLEEDYPDSGLYEKYHSLYIQGKDLTVTKKYIAACPVDVYVYDSADNLVAYVVDNKPYCSSNLTVAVVDDTKELYFYDEEEYRIEYVGNDVGSMDLTIAEYDSDGTQQRNVYFYDVDLNDGKTYTIGETEQNSDEVTYSLDEKDGETVQPNLDTNNTNDEKYTVCINSGSMIIDNELFLETDAYSDESIDIYAYVPDGYEFYGWTSDLGTDIFENASSRITTLRVPASDVTINAISVNGSGETYTITFNANGGAVTPATAVTGTDGMIISLPTPTREGYTFNGWFTATSGGKQIATDTVFTADTTVYAHWTKNNGTPENPTPTSTYTISFDANGGVLSGSATMTTNENGKLASLPSATRSGYTFKGWYTATESGEQITTDTVFDADTTVYAQWTQNSSSSSNGGSSSGGGSGSSGGGSSSGGNQNPPSSNVTPETPVTVSFTDIESGAYYYDAVLWAVKNGVTTGTTATTFSPENSCTRAQMVTFLWRAAGSPAPKGGENPFADVKSGAYYYDAVQWAVEQGITTGTTAATFSPDATVTRGQTVTFLYRAAGSPATSGNNPFTDLDANAYYIDAVQWAVSKGVTTGTSVETFSPDDPCTRGQIVTFLYRDRVEQK